MEFTQEELVYLHNSVVAHTDHVTKKFHSARRVVVDYPSKVSLFTDDFLSMLEDLKFGNALMLKMHSSMECDQNWEERDAEIRENQVFIEESLKSLQNVIAAIKDKDE
jgi:hypothetical protein